MWPQIIYGDGGQSGFNVGGRCKLRFNTFTGQANDANFRGGDPTKWVIISAPILSSPEASFFYPPIIADPHPAMAGSIFQGSFSVWRTQNWGGDQALSRSECPEFTTSAVKPGCGDFVIIGNGVPSTQLTAAAWGNRAGGAVAWIQRTARDIGIDVGGDQHRPRVRHRQCQRSRRLPWSGTASIPIRPGSIRRAAPSARFTSIRRTRITRGFPITVTTSTRRRSPGTSSK